MKNRKILIFIVAVIFSNPTVNGQELIVGEPPKDQIVYTCGPCGCQYDGSYFDSIGACPSCNMALQASLPGWNSEMPSSRRLSAAIMLFDHADIMDVTGPWSVLVHNGVSVVTFAKSKETVSIGMSMELTPDFTLDNVPDVDILVFPGGGLAESNPGDKDIVNFIQEREPTTDVLFSVCSGAFFLAEAGVLDGKEATTFASLIPQLDREYPNIVVRNDRKYIGAGKVVTTAGLSSGIDGTFYVISKFRGEGPVQDVANHMEYPWSRSTEYARTQLADNFIVGIKGVLEMFSKKYLYSNGTIDSWKYKYLLSDKITPDRVITMISTQLKNTNKWKQRKKTDNSLQGIYNHKVLGEGEISITVTNSSDGNVIEVSASRRETYKASIK